MTDRCSTCDGPLPVHYPACPKDRPWQVHIGLRRVRTFGSLRAAEGAALDSVAHGPIGTEALIRHRRTGPYMALRRIPARRVLVTFQEWPVMS